MMIALRLYETMADRAHQIISNNLHEECLASLCKATFLRLQLPRNRRGLKYEDESFNADYSCIFPLRTGCHSEFSVKNHIYLSEHEAARR